MLIIVPGLFRFLNAQNQTKLKQSYDKYANKVKPYSYENIDARAYIWYILFDMYIYSHGYNLKNTRISINIINGALLETEFLFNLLVSVIN